MEADLPVRIRRAVEQILELHLGELFVSQEDFAGA